MKNNIKTIGFTGTQCGMTLKQQGKLIDFLETLHDDNCDHQITLRHGDGVGSDYEMHHIGKLMGYHIVIHPPIIDTLRAFCDGDEVMTPRDYLDRNKDIVNNCDLLIAAPKENTEVLHSGTWSTVRYAKQLGVNVVIIEP